MESICEMGLIGYGSSALTCSQSLNLVSFSLSQTRACEHIEHSPNLFSAPQCLGYRNEKGIATQEMCFPSKETVFKQVKQAVKQYGAKSIFVSSDHDHLIADLTKVLKRMQVSSSFSNLMK